MRKALVFALERLIQRGIAFQLLLMALLVLLVAVAGGLCAWTCTTKFAQPFEAIWWAFLRLTDPGYLGDDEGAVLRTISTIVTVLGYVLFMGSLIAIMTQWLATHIRTLERGLTPITMRKHVIVLGWTNRTVQLVKTIVGAKGRLQRFLNEHDARHLTIVVLADDVDRELHLTLQEALRGIPHRSRILLRSGSSLQPEHLQRLDIKRAAAILVPGSDFELGGVERTDARVVTTLLTMRGMFRGMAQNERPQLVAEVFDSDNAALCEQALGDNVEVVTTDRVICRLISQSIRQRGLSGVLASLMVHRQGDSLYLRRFPTLTGHTPQQLAPVFAHAVVLGIVRTTATGMQTILDPMTSATLQPDDLLVLLAESYAQCQPTTTTPTTRNVPPPSRRHELPEPHSSERLLVLGWSHKVARLVAELAASSSAHMDLTIISKVDVDVRIAALTELGVAAEHVKVQHICADYCMERELTQVNLAAFDHVLFVASGRMGSSQEADARTVLGFVLLRALLANQRAKPQILVELLDPANTHLFGDASEAHVLVSPQILSHVLGHVALRPELNAVFEALFSAGGPEISLQSADAVGLSGQDVDFATIQTTAHAFGVTALGILSPREQGNAQVVDMNPQRSRRWHLTKDHKLIVLIMRS